MQWKQALNPESQTLNPRQILLSLRNATVMMEVEIFYHWNS